MTTDIVKHREAQKSLSAVANVLEGDFWKAGKDQNKEDARDRFRYSEAQQLFELIEQHKLDKDGWQRCMSATVALLEYAHNMLDKAETIISEHGKRITMLEDLATTDELTGLQNRRGFFGAFTQELDRTHRGLNNGGLLVLIDLDNFKAINDTYGHMAGDACLRLVARTLENEIRVMDVAARLGGDEFVLLLSNTTKKDAATRAQDLAWHLNNLSLAWYGHEIPVRASLGLKSYNAGDDAKKIFNDADMRLYTKKREKSDLNNNNQQASGGH